MMMVPFFVPPAIQSEMFRWLHYYLLSYIFWISFDHETCMLRFASCELKIFKQDFGLADSIVGTSYSEAISESSC